MLFVAGRYGAAGGGTQTAAFCAGGSNPGTTNHQSTEEWDWSSTLAAGAWASGGDLNVAKSQMGSSRNGTQTASSVFFGQTPPNTKITTHEQYDGSSWTEVADGNTTRRNPGSFGTQTASLAVSGPGAPSPDTPTHCETWNGASWTEVGDCNTYRQGMGGTGLQTAGLVAGGANGSAPNWAKAESWNGTSWTEVGDLNTQRGYQGAAGTSTAALHYGGGNPGGNNQTVCELWNGTAWTEVADINTGRKSMGGFGTSTSALCAAGGTYPTTEAEVESWDGTAWTEEADVSQSRAVENGTAGTSSLGIIAGGDNYSGTFYNNTEEWTVGQNIKTITD